MNLEALLSPPQYEAATLLSAPVCILAGAGSGKTRVITHRIAWLMTEHRVAAESILGVTFTNKAAGEMRHRVEGLVPGRGARVQLGTFHGLAARLLRRFGRLVDVDPSFVIYDADDAERLLQRIITGDLDQSKDLTGPVARMIDSWQSAGLTPTDVPKGSELYFDTAIKAYTRYVEKLGESRALDFGGLLVKLRQLVTGPDHEVITRKVRHVLADEYQDVNQVQADIVLALARGADSCAVVGDDDQAIYGWRGASTDNLQKFLHALPGARLVKLEENYRSTPAILEAANGVIAKNEVRLGKVLVPARRDGGNDRGRLVRVLKNANDLDEARRIVMYIVEHIAAGVHLDEIAVLYRTNGASRVIEDELRRHRLPYRIVGGVRFYDRKEIKDVLATLRVALNRQSDVDGLRFMAAVPRGVGSTSMAKIEVIARQKGRPLFVAMADPLVLKEAGLNASTQKKVQGIIAQLDELAQKIGRPQRPDPQPGLFVASSSLGAKDAVALAVQVSGVADRLEAEGGIEAGGRQENLMELVNAAAAFEETARRAGDVADIEAFLESASLLGSADDAPVDEGNNRGRVTLMTLHACKGLEFEVVFMAGLEEHGFPHSRAILDDADTSGLEEERRLAYVGITRARSRLVMSWAAQRMVNGVLKQRDPSRFLFEIPSAVLEGDLPRRRQNSSYDQRESLLEQWHRRHAPKRPSDDVGDGSPRVVYDDDAFDDAPAPKASRTRLVMTEPGGASASAEVDDQLEVTSGDGPRAVVEAPGGPRPAGRRFVLGVPASPASAASPPRAPAVDAIGLGADTGDDPSFSAGARVQHRLFGEGTVVGQRGGGRMATVLVRFDGERGPRVIASRFLAAC